MEWLGRPVPGLRLLVNKSLYLLLIRAGPMLLVSVPTHRIRDAAASVSAPDVPTEIVSASTWMAVMIAPATVASVQGCLARPGMGITGMGRGGSSMFLTVARERAVRLSRSWSTDRLAVAAGVRYHQYATHGAEASAGMGRDPRRGLCPSRGTLA